LTARRGAAYNPTADVTGLGLLGHLCEMTGGGGVRARLDASRNPLLPEVVALAEAGFVPGGTRRNLRAVADAVRWAEAIPEPLRAVMGTRRPRAGCWSPPAMPRRSSASWPAPA